MAHAEGPRYRIAHTEASAGWGGQEIRVLREARGFRNRGHDVVVYAPPGSRILAEAPRFGVPATALPIGDKRPRGVGALVGAFRAHPVDIVNTHSSTDTWLAALACRWLRARGRAHPVLIRTRHVSVPVPNNRSTRWLYQRATLRIVTTGDALREQLIRDNGIDPERIDSVPTGIDPSAFGAIDRDAARVALGLPAAVPLIGIVATLRSWKGHRFLVEALPQVRAPDARLVVVGDGPQRDALREQVSALGLDARVLFAGQQNDVAPWLAALDVFALPSYANEGVPQALLQAMFAGVPCVTTDAGAIPQVARDGETAVVVARESPAAIAAGIDAILAAPDRGAAMAARARASVDGRYTEAVMLDQMDAVFRRALAEASR
jgi:glycosyltransferase involved in cell wall biosynthesis